jgi:hypothetical protein
MPLRVAKDLDCVSHLKNTVRLCLIHTYHAATVFDSHIPCRALTVLRPCCFARSFSRPRHGLCESTLTISVRPVGDLPTFGFSRQPGGASRQAVRFFSGYKRTFTKDTALSDGMACVNYLYRSCWAIH